MKYIQTNIFTNYNRNKPSAGEALGALLTWNGSKARIKRGIVMASWIDERTTRRGAGVSRRSFLKIGGLASAGAVLFGLTGCGSSSSTGTAASAASAASSAVSTHTVTDIKGAAVDLPVQIDSIVDLWHAHNQIVLMLGAADKLVGTTQNFKNMKWANVVYPNLANVQTIVTGSGSNQEVNYEEVLNLDPDVIFASADNMVTECRNRGLNAVNVMFQDYAGLRKDVAITAEVLGEDAQALANQWTELLDKNIKLVEDRMSGVSSADKPKVLHIVNGNNLVNVDGTDCIVDEWIKLAGGVNAIQTAGNMIDVTMEDIVNANPDVIIIGSNGARAAVENLLADSAWSGITAVQNGAVYANPLGVFAWDRYSGEEALQVLWAAKKLNPDVFSDIDMVAQAQEFYQTFYGFTLSTEQATRIVNAEDPA